MLRRAEESSRFTACCSNAMAKSWMPAEAWLLSSDGFWAPSYNCTHWCGDTAAVSHPWPEKNCGEITKHRLRAGEKR